MKRNLHKHHIIPKHAGGTNDPDNLVELTVEEHAEAHRLLWLQYGRKADLMAWRLISGNTHEKEQLRKEVALEAYEAACVDPLRKQKMLEGSLNAGIKIRDEKLGIHDPSLGWKRIGGLASKGVKKPIFHEYKWINNGITHSRKKIDEIPEGWVVGRLKWKDTKPRVRFECHYCGGKFTRPRLNQYHNENCRQKP